MFRKILYIFNEEKKITFMVIFISLFLISVLEILSIGSIFPVLSLLINQKSTNIQILDNIFFNDNFDQKISIIYFLISISLIFIIKNISLGLFNWFKIKYSQKICLNLQEKLFRNYLKFPIKNFLKTNSSLLMRNIDGEPKLLLKQYINPFFILIQELFISAVIMSLLFVTYPKIFGLIFLLFIIFVYPFYYFTKKTIKKLSIKRLFLVGQKSTFLREGIELIRDIKIYNKKNFFLKRYIKSNARVNFINLNIGFIGLLPKLFFEILIVILGLFSTFIAVFFYDINMVSIIPSLGLIGAVLFKIIPSSIKVISQYQKMEGCRPSINLLNKILENSEEYKNINTGDIFEKFEKIQLKDIFYKYDQDYVIKNLNFEILKKDIVVIKGESGQGKSTFINILSGLIKPSEGEIFVNNNKYLHDKMVTSKFGYVGASNYFIDGDIRENIYLKNKGEITDQELNNLDNLMDIVELSNFKKHYDRLIGEKADKLSEGQKQRLAIARAIAFRPDILIFDEATNSIDRETESKIFNNIHKKIPEITLIVITHRDLKIENPHKLLFFYNKKLNETKSS